MQKKYWLFLFGFFLAVHLGGILFADRLLQAVTKPLLLLFLLRYLLVSTPRKRGLHAWPLFALLFSWVGDVLLLFQVRSDLFFLAGLSAFLIAHICYCLLFHAIRIREGIRSRAWLLAPVAAYYFALILLLSPHLGGMKLPVQVYGLVISFMFLLALHLLWLSDRRTGRLLALGAALFVLSDSLLAINKFYQSFAGAGFLIMLTYGLAQLLLTLGVVRVISVAGQTALSSSEPG